ncbi:hypothetical protein FRC08_000909 [Ceratobasidium sp. 394]|nr:hypothetical protein FRC08_000909 [Ceratobasidium sp. 394]
MGKTKITGRKSTSGSAPRKPLATYQRQEDGTMLEFTGGSTPRTPDPAVVAVLSAAASSSRDHELEKDKVRL